LMGDRMVRTVCPKCGCIFDSKEGNKEGIIRLIDETKEARFGEILERSHLSKPSVSKYLNELAEEGEIHREWNSKVFEELKTGERKGE